MADARRHRSFWRLRNDGGPGVPMLPCICGHREFSILFQPGRSDMSVKPPETFLLDRFATPIGIALLVTDAEGALRALGWEDYQPRMRQLLRLQHAAAVLMDGRAPENVRAALTAYFAGDLDRLKSIPWRVAGTPF